MGNHLEPCPGLPIGQPGNVVDPAICRGSFDVSRNRRHMQPTLNAREGRESLAIMRRVVTSDESLRSFSVSASVIIEDSGAGQQTRACLVSHSAGAPGGRERRHGAADARPTAEAWWPGTSRSGPSVPMNHSAVGLAATATAPPRGFRLEDDQ